MTAKLKSNNSSHSLNVYSVLCKADYTPVVFNWRAILPSRERLAMSSNTFGVTTVEKVLLVSSV